jgi:predicted AlkP superfamily pyrophosphatase or phosphodiesterase
MSTRKKICLVNAVGLTPRHAQKLKSTIGLGTIAPWKSPTPAVTCSSQASMLTESEPHQHGIVANGWYSRDTQEIRFWQQSFQLLDAPVFYNKYKTASIFWWFAQGCPAQWSVIPKPHYGCDGSKFLDILDRTDCNLQTQLGPFPFHAFWGPFSGLASSQWLAKAGMLTMETHRPELTMIYLPHLDYGDQRQTPGDPKALGELDDLLGQIRQCCDKLNIQLAVCSEYGLEAVQQAVFLNRAFQKQGWIKTRPGPTGTQLIPWESPCFAVCDHQLAHIYIQPQLSIREVQNFIRQIEGIDIVEPSEHFGLQHQRSGELVVVAQKGHWLAYPYWNSEDPPPDYAKTIDIHRKPGYDPCELFLGSKWNLGRRILQKKLGMRTRFDIIQNDEYLVKGSHGRQVLGEDGPVFIGEKPPSNMTELGGWCRDILG